MRKPRVVAYASRRNLSHCHTAVHDCYRWHSRGSFSMLVQQRLVIEWSAPAFLPVRFLRTGRAGGIPPISTTSTDASRVSAAPDAATTSIMTAAPQPAKRLAYIDWMRGLACVLMFQTHCYDSWLAPEARKSTALRLVATRRHAPRPALPLSFRHFLRAGHRATPRKGAIARNAIAKTTIRRGAEIFAPRPAFPPPGIRPRLPLVPVDRSVPRRCPQHSRPLHDADGRSVLADGVRRKAHAVRVHFVIHSPVGCVRNSMPIETSWLAKSRDRAIFGGLAVAAIVALVTPLVWTTHAFDLACPGHWNPTSTASTSSAARKPWLFPIFPWTAFAFAGLADRFLPLRRHRQDKMKQKRSWF